MSETIPALPDGSNTRLYYASFQAIEGILFRLGENALFSPMEDPQVYIVDPATMSVTGEVADGPVKAYILSELAKKLYQIGGAS